MGRVHGKLRDFLTRSELISLIGTRNIFLRLPDACRWAKVLLLEAHRAATTDLEGQYNRAAVELNPKEPKSKDGDDEKSQETTILEPLVFVSFPNEGFLVEEEENQGASHQPLTHNLRTFGQPEDSESIAREKLWWKGFM